MFGFGGIKQGGLRGHIVVTTVLVLFASLLVAQPAQAADTTVLLSAVSINRNDVRGRLAVSAHIGVQGHWAVGGICDGDPECRAGLEVRRLADGQAVQVSTTGTNTVDDLAEDPASYSDTVSGVLAPTIDAVRGYVTSVNGTKYSEWVSVSDPYPTSTVVTVANVQVTRGTGGALTVNGSITVSGHWMPGGICFGTVDCQQGFEVRRAVDGQIEALAGSTYFTDQFRDPRTYSLATTAAVPTVAAVRAYVASSSGRVHSAWVSVADSYPTSTSISLANVTCPGFRGVLASG